MAEVTFRHGDDVRYIDYTPTGGNVAEGEVVMLGNTTGLTCGVAHVPIVNNTKGALAVGHGVYQGVNLNNAANYATVYWDTATNKFTTVSTNMMKFGYIAASGGGGANTNCDVLHVPYA